jgi:hypothetical protein
MTYFVPEGGGKTSISISLMAAAHSALIDVSLIQTDRSATKLTSVFLVCREGTAHETFIEKLGLAVVELGVTEVN